MPASEFSKRFGIAVWNHRIAPGVTQEDLSERAGLRSTYVRMVERGVLNPTLGVAARIAKALKVGLPVLIREALPEQGGRPRRA